MTVTWLGHSCFCVESDGYRIVLDPYTVESYPPLSVSAHEILCSHGHRDHNFAEAVTILPTGRENPFAVEKIAAFHDEKDGALRGGNTMHVLRAGGLTLVHCGDLGHELDEKQLAAIRNCDALLIPVGGYYTVDAHTAKRIVDAVQPRVTVPMHYRFGAHGYDVIATLEPFTEQFAVEKVQYLAGNSFALSEDAPAGVIIPKFMA